MEIYNSYFFMFQSIKLILRNVNFCILKQCSKHLQFEEQWPNHFLRKKTFIRNEILYLWNYNYPYWYLAYMNFFLCIGCVSIKMRTQCSFILKFSIPCFLVKHIFFYLSNRLRMSIFNTCVCHISPM